VWNKRLGYLALAAAIAATASSVSAATFTYGVGPTDTATANNAPSTGAAAQVDFALSGGDLIVTLTNLSTASTGNGSELTAVFWNSDAIGGTFSKVALGGNSSVLYGGSSFTTGTHLSGDAGSGGAGWYAYGNNLNLDSGQNFGLSSAGLGLSYTLPYLSLNGESAPPTFYSPNSPDGPNGGLAGTGGVDSNLASRAVVSNALVFTVSGVGTNFNLGSITDVQFQYNTTRAGASAVPLPAAAWMGFSALVGAGILKARKRIKNR
jgi:hypothetical protein